MARKAFATRRCAADYRCRWGGRTITVATSAHTLLPVRVCPHQVLHENNATIRGMVHSIKHMVEVQPVHVDPDAPALEIVKRVRTLVEPYANAPLTCATVLLAGPRNISDQQPEDGWV